MLVKNKHLIKKLLIINGFIDKSDDYDAFIGNHCNEQLCCFCFYKSTVYVDIFDKNNTYFPFTKYLNYENSIFDTYKAIKR